MENIIKQKLIERGFKEETLLNNRGLIGATIDETEKQLRIGVVIQRSELLIAFLDYLEESEGAGETIVDRQAFVGGFLKAIYGV